MHNIFKLKGLTCMTVISKTLLKPYLMFSCFIRNGTALLSKKKKIKISKDFKVCMSPIAPWPQKSKCTECKINIILNDMNPLNQ